jgi:hypothetical protein
MHGVVDKSLEDTVSLYTNAKLENYLWNKTMMLHVAIEKLDIEEKSTNVIRKYFLVEFKVIRFEWVEGCNGLTLHWCMIYVMNCEFYIFDEHYTKCLQRSMTELKSTSYWIFMLQECQASTSISLWWRRNVVSMVWLLMKNSDFLGCISYLPVLAIFP